MVLLAVNSGHFDDVVGGDALSMEKALRDYLKAKHAALIDRIESTKDLPKDDEKALLDAIDAFKKGAR